MLKITIVSDENGKTIIWFFCRWNINFHPVIYLVGIFLRLRPHVLWNFCPLVSKNLLILIFHNRLLWSSFAFAIDLLTIIIQTFRNIDIIIFSRYFMIYLHYGHALFLIHRVFQKKKTLFFNYFIINNR